MTRLLLIAAPGLDLAGFERRRMQGGLPALAAICARGVAGALSGAPLSDGPAALATAASGVEPEFHGVWRDQEAWPGGLRPVGASSWRTLPVWARLEEAGVSTGSVCWPAMTPGAGWAGVHIDDRFCEVTGKTAADWALPRGCVPDDLRHTLRVRRTHITQIDGDMIAPFVPGADLAHFSRDDTLATLAMAMARTATVQAAASWMLAERRTEAVFVCHPLVGQIRTAFADRAGPPFGEIVPAAWRLLDALVGALVALAGPEALTMILSPGRRGAAGMVLAAGPGAPPGAEVSRGRLIDVVPTVLARFGLGDPDLPGRSLWPAPGRLRLGAGPRPPAPIALDEAAAAALRARGYPPPPAPGPAWRARGLTELALMMLERDPVGALAAAEAALANVPGEPTALQIKARAHVALGQADPLPALGDALIAASPERGWGDLAHAACHVIRGERALATTWLTKAEADDDIACLLTTAAVWLGAGRPAAAERVFKRVLNRDPANVTAGLGVAIGEIARRDFLNAERRLVAALKQDPGRPAIYLQLAQCYARSARNSEAARAADMARRLGAAPSLAAAARLGRLET